MSDRFAGKDLGGRRGYERGVRHQDDSSKVGEDDANEESRKIVSVEARDDGKLRFLLGALTEETRRRFLFDDVARFSITRSDQAIELCDLIKSSKVLDPSVSTICDGCACVGGNAMIFDDRFAHTTCVELDPFRAALLRSNLLSNNPASFVVHCLSCIIHIVISFVMYQQESNCNM